VVKTFCILIFIYIYFVIFVTFYIKIIILKIMDQITFYYNIIYYNNKNDNNLIKLKTRMTFRINNKYI